MQYRIVLDFGHGGNKPGASYGGFLEKNLNMQIGLELYDALHHKKGTDDLQIMLTRDADYDIPLRARYGLINKHHRNMPIDLVVSLHYNAAGSSKAQGFEAYYSENSRKGISAAKQISSQVHAQGVSLRGDGLVSTQRLGRALAMIHKTAPPSVLLEIGYLTNSVDLQLSQNAAFRAKVVQGIATGIWDYIKGEKNV